MMNSNNILVLYGSETGTAQEVAEGIWRDSIRFGFNGTVMSMDDYDVLKLIFEPLIIFVCSTTGQGDPPANMKKFWRFILRKSLPSNSLVNSLIAVLGLGDSSYTKFNFAAKKLFRRLVALGGRAVVDIGLSDDQHDLGLDAVAGPWTSQLWTALEHHYPSLKQDREMADPNSLILRWKTVPSNRTPEELYFPPGEPTELCTCTLIENKRVTSEQHFQDVRRVVFRPTGGSVEYSPGAVACLRPSNSPSSVEQILSLVQGRLESPHFTLEPDHLPLPPLFRGKVLSLRDLATVYWDLNSVARRRMFEVLSRTTESELEREKLEEFLSPGGLEELYSYSNRPRRTVLEVLTDFPSATAGLTLNHLFEIFQPIRPRAYSISSSVEYDGPVIQILVAVVRYKTRLSTPRVGLATNWLASLAPNQKLHLALKPPTLTFPKEAPVIMVGPGTGVAPFRSYISQTIAKKFGKGDVPKQQMILIFGSRYEKKDFHFGEEFSKWASSGELTLITAFSRDQPEKIYVQDRILSEGGTLFESIYECGGHVYVAGSSKDMPEAVWNAFVQVIADKSRLSTEEAEAYLRELEAHSRYQQETWS